MPSGLFTTFAQSSRPLSQKLDHDYGRPATRQLENLRSLEDVERAIDSIVSGVRVDPPGLLGIEMEHQPQQDGRARPIDRSRRDPTRRLLVAIEVVGESSLLEYWPDRSERSLVVVDQWNRAQDPNEPLRAADLYDHEYELERYNYMQARDLWSLRQRNDGRIALYTWVDLTRSDFAAVDAKTLDPRREIDRNRTAIQPIVDEIAKQVRGYFDHDLPTALHEHAERLRRERRAEQSVYENLTWEAGWKQSPLQLTVESGAEIKDLAVDTLVARDEMQTVEIPRSRRLSDASFEDVVQTVRIWANAVERYPDAFSKLSEDHLSDLLAATLNAALPGAGREIYNRRGKSDIQVRGEAIDSGAGPEVVFICESKWWNGPQAIGDAITQLEGYLQVRDTAATLLIFIKTRDAKRTAEKAASYVSRHPAANAGPSDEVAGWPVYELDLEYRKVRLCLATVLIPPARVQTVSIENRI